MHGKGAKDESWHNHYGERLDTCSYNFIASSLFADGCGAVILAGDSLQGNWARRISVESSSSVTWPDTLDIMGWKIVEKSTHPWFFKYLRPQKKNPAGRSRAGDLTCGRLAPCLRPLAGHGVNCTARIGKKEKHSGAGRSLLLRQLVQVPFHRVDQRETQFQQPIFYF